MEMLTLKMAREYADNHVKVFDFDSLGITPKILELLATMGGKTEIHALEKFWEEIPTNGNFTCKMTVDEEGNKCVAIPTDVLYNASGIAIYVVIDSKLPMIDSVDGIMKMSLILRRSISGATGKYNSTSIKLKVEQM